VVSHKTNNSFMLTNRLLKAGAPVYWLKGTTNVSGATLAPGALWIPAGGRGNPIIKDAVLSLGLDVYAVDKKPAGDTINVKAPRIGLVDVYGGSMASGHTRWIFEQYEFPYTRVYPQELDKGRLNKKYDVLVFQTDVMGRPGRRERPQPESQDIPAEWRMALGKITPEKTIPQVAAFAKAGGTVITIGDASSMAADLGVPVINALSSVDASGRRTPLPSTKFYVPGSVLQAKVDINDPLAYGMAETVDVFYNNNPTYTIAPNASGVKRVSWFASDDPLRSGWAWGQKALNNTSSVIDATLGRGRVFVLGPEVTQRGQAYGTFKFLFNGLFYGPSQSGKALAAATPDTAVGRED
jgi:hypothetical protein